MNYCIGWVRSGTEFALADELGGYSPASLCQTRPRRKRKAVTVRRPAFPCYTFFPSSAFYAAREHRDVIRILKEDSGSLSLISLEEVNRIRLLEKAGAFDQIPVSAGGRRLALGEKVRIESGVFSGLVGEVIDVSRFKDVVGLLVYGKKTFVGLPFIAEIEDT